MREILAGLYARNIYLVGSALSRRWRESTNRLLGKSSRFFQETRLPKTSWSHLFKTRYAKIWETERTNGNIRISELAIIAAGAADCPAHSNIFEIGTFDGRTTLNLALNSDPTCRVFTLDLPREIETKFPLAKGEKHMVRKNRSGARYEQYQKTHPTAINRVTQLFGDSAAFDFGPYRESCSLVFVDGSHAYQYVKADTATALGMLRPGGVILWHDYGIWEGVTQALEEIERDQRLGLRHIRGTSLVWFRKGL